MVGGIGSKSNSNESCIRRLAFGEMTVFCCLLLVMLTATVLPKSSITANTISGKFEAATPISSPFM